MHHHPGWMQRGMRSALALFVLATAALASGCYVHGSTAVIVDTPPPPPRHVVVRTRPGHIYVNGYWQMRGARWFWVDGYWQPHRVGHIYVQGRWIHRGGRYHWVDPHWQSRGSVSVRSRGDVGRRRIDRGAERRIRVRSRGHRDVRVRRR
jgi:hypothetical protein